MTKCDCALARLLVQRMESLSRRSWRRLWRAPKPKHALTICASQNSADSAYKRLFDLVPPDVRRCIISRTFTWPNGSTIRVAVAVAGVDHDASGLGLQVTAERSWFDEADWLS